MTTPGKSSMRPTALGLVVLGMLIEQPMHVYRMQKLIKERGKDKVVNVRQRTSLHQVIDRLTTHGLVEQVGEGDASENYPSRRSYRITPAGRQTAIDWLTAMVTEVPDEFPQLPAALSVLTMVAPDTAAELITARITTIEHTLNELRSERGGYEVPRIYLLEDEYRTRGLESEAAWLGEVRHDIERGELTWTAPDAPPYEPEEPK
ncbi:PadR family transcriptional regulator [Flexivirga alba]|uniref:PadR family transcriptional regulator n=1 Tax=Flexivirga alba TaxID=702742 RepID=A0ABW2ACP0_9MICO